jgi:hypothetical protein
MIPSSRWDEGKKGSIRAAILDPTTGAKMMALQVSPMIACDKEKEWRVDTLESLPSFYQRPKIWLP